MATIQVTTEDLEQAKQVLIDADYDATNVINWLDYMIAGMEQAARMADKEWITKE